jgi:hypothetical protein
MKSNQNGQDLTDGQGTALLALFLSAGKQLLVPFWQKVPSKNHRHHKTT